MLMAAQWANVCARVRMSLRRAVSRGGCADGVIIMVHTRFLGSGFKFSLHSMSTRMGRRLLVLHARINGKKVRHAH